jgi:four helix bundle protein
VKGTKGDKGLETLLVWERSIEFATKVCVHTLPLFPEEEKWSLTHQLRRSVQRIPANIAEGYGRYYYQDSIRFCCIPRGSLEESFSHIKLAQNLGYLQNNAFDQLFEDVQELRRMINGYISYLKRSKRGATEPGANLTVQEGPVTYNHGSENDIFEL